MSMGYKSLKKFTGEEKREYSPYFETITGDLQRYFHSKKRNYETIGDCYRDFVKNFQQEVFCSVDDDYTGMKQKRILSFIDCKMYHYAKNLMTKDRSKVVFVSVNGERTRRFRVERKKNSGRKAGSKNGNFLVIKSMEWEKKMKKLEQKKHSTFIRRKKSRKRKRKVYDTPSSSDLSDSDEDVKKKDDMMEDEGEEEEEGEEEGDEEEEDEEEEEEEEEEDESNEDMDEDDEYEIQVMQRKSKKKKKKKKSKKKSSKKHKRSKKKKRRLNEDD